MTYEEKLAKILNGINEARKIYGQIGLIKLYPNKTTGLDDFDPNEIYDILAKIESEEKILKVKEVPAIIRFRIGTSNEDALYNTNTYFLIEVLTNFDRWHTSFSSRNKDKEENSLKNLNYDDKTGCLHIVGKVVKLQKGSFRTNLLAALLKDEKSRKQEWDWEKIIRKIEYISDNVDVPKEYKKKFYSACDGLQKFIAMKTGVNNLLLFNNSTVQINPDYL